MTWPYYALGWSGFVIVIVAGWTTAITNLYRAGLAAQGRVLELLPAEIPRWRSAWRWSSSPAFPSSFPRSCPCLRTRACWWYPSARSYLRSTRSSPASATPATGLSSRITRTALPAVASWGLGLAFGFGLNFLNVMSFYYLFIPTWFFTIAVYTLLAGRYGAKETYPEAAAREEQYDELVDAYHLQLAAEEPWCTRITQYSPKC